jgi:predicted N-acetyltransferase YhbS
MAVQFTKAGAEDYDEVIDLGNYVFSQAHVPHDFPVLLPKLYKREYFMDGTHYIAREDGRIRAVVGAYPLEMQVCGDRLPGRGIGMVSVHPYCRSRGFMKALMDMALEDMKRDGMAFSCLGGQRQRYEHFGYVPAGLSCVFDCTVANIRHTLGRDFKTGFSLQRINAGNADALDYIYRTHEAKNARVLRQKDRLFDILSSWNSVVFTVAEGRQTAGYLLYKPDGKLIHEINIEDNSRMAEVMGLVLGDQGCDGVRVRAMPHETEKIAAFSRFAEDYRLSSAYSVAVFDYPRFLLPFMKLKSSVRTLPDGKLTVRIEDGPCLVLKVEGGKVSVSESREPADLRAGRMDAVRFLFSADYGAGSPIIAANPFLQSLLPLPFFVETADEV